MLFQMSEKVKLIWEKSKATLNWQKSYIDMRRRQDEFVVGDKVHLRVLPMQGVVCFGARGFSSLLTLMMWWTMLVHDVFLISKQKCYVQADSHA